METNKYVIYKQPYANGYFWKVIGYSFVGITRNEAREYVRFLKSKNTGANK